MGRWGVPGPATEASTAQLRLEDRLPRVDGVHTGPFAEFELQALQLPGVRVGTGNGAANLALLDQADPGPRRRQLVRHRRTQPSQQTRVPGPSSPTTGSSRTRAASRRRCSSA